MVGFRKIGVPSSYAKFQESWAGQTFSANAYKVKAKLVYVRCLIGVHLQFPNVHTNTLGDQMSLTKKLQQNDGEACLQSSPHELQWLSSIPSQFPSVYKTPRGVKCPPPTLSNKTMAKLVYSHHLMNFSGHRASPRSFQVSTNHLEGSSVLHPHCSTKQWQSSSTVITWSGHLASPRSCKSSTSALPPRLFGFGS